MQQYMGNVQVEVLFFLLGPNPPVTHHVPPHTPSLSIPTPRPTLFQRACPLSTRPLSQSPFLRDLC